MADPQDVLDGREHIDRGVALAHHGLVLEVGAGKEANAPVGIDVVGAILRVVLDDDDECGVGVWAVGDSLDEAIAWIRDHLDRFRVETYAN